MNQWELKIKSGTLRKARENASNQVEIGFSFAFDWPRWWREFFRPITGKVKKTYGKQSTISWKPR